MAKPRTVSSESAVRYLFEAMMVNRDHWDPRLKDVQISGQKLLLVWKDEDGRQYKTTLSPTEGRKP